MAFRLAEAYVQVSQRGIGTVTGAIGSLGKKILSLVNPTNMLAGAISGLGSAFGTIGAIRAFGVQEAAEKRLEAVIRATGGAAGYTADQLKQMATDLQKVTRFGDETTIAAQAVLATFKSIRGETFEHALKSAMDLSEVLGTDLQSSVMQIGKALEDPARGLTSLHRVGVSFSEEERKLIEQLIEAGKIAEAQGIILSAIEGQVGGTAETMARTSQGAWQQMKNAFSDLLEKIGEGIIETLNLTEAMQRATEFLSSLWEKHGEEIRGVFRRVTDYIKGLWQTLAPVIMPALQSIVQALGVLFDAAVQGANLMIQLFAPIVGMIVGIIKAIADWIKSHRDLVVTLTMVAAAVGAVTVGVYALTTAVGVLGTVIGFLTSPIGLVVVALTGLVFLFKDFFKGLIAGLLDVIRNWDLAWRLAWEKTKLFVGNMWERIKTFFVNIPILLKWFWNNWRDIFKTVWDYTTTVFVNLGKNLKNLWRAIKGFFSGEGWQFDWTPLTEGFKSSIKAWPELAKANVRDTNEAIEKLQKEWARRRAARAKQEAIEVEKAAEDGRQQIGAAAGLPTGLPAGKLGGAVTGASTRGAAAGGRGGFEFVGLAQLAERMQREASTRLGERQALAAEKTAAATENVAAATESGVMRVRIVDGEEGVRAAPVWR